MKDRTAVQMIALLAGAAFVAVGVLGFVPGVTTDYSDLAFAGHESEAHLLGLFQVSILHNIVHLLFGVAGLAMAKNAKSATTYLIGGGVIYLVLTVYGVLVGSNSPANFVPVNGADDLLHLVLGIAMIGLGMIGRKALAPGTGAGSVR